MNLTKEEEEYTCAWMFPGTRLGALPPREARARDFTSWLVWVYLGGHRLMFRIR